MLDARLTGEGKGTNSGGLTAAAGLVVVAVPVVLGLLVYWDFLDVWFWTDDFLWLQTPATSDAEGVFREAFAFPRGASPYWRPLIDLYFYGMYETFGLNATAYHVATLGVHVATAALLGFFALRLTRSLMVAALASGLYVISPTYSTMIPWASGIGAAFSGFFAVGMALLFLQWLEERRRRWLVLSAVALAGALLSKEDAAALPAVLVLMTLAVEQPSSLRELRGASLLVLPLMGVWLAYTIPQFVGVIGSDEATRFSFGWHAVPKIGIALSWLSLPYPLWYADWVSVSRWVALGGFTSIAIGSAVRKAWLLPALYLATVAMLLPSSFLTSDFAPRWTYHASLSWAMFIAVVFVGAYRYLSSLYAPLGLAAGLVAAFALITLLSARAIDSQIWVPSTAESYQQIERAFATGCADLRKDGNVYLFPLPIGGPGFREYAVPQLIRMVKPGTQVYQVGRLTNPTRPPPPQPEPNDCALAWNEVDQYIAETIE